jgi:hypothetical protein
MQSKTVLQASLHHPSMAKMRPQAKVQSERSPQAEIPPAFTATRMTSSLSF